MSARYWPAIYGVLGCAVGVSTIALQGVVVAEADPSVALLARGYGALQLAAGIAVLCLLAIGRRFAYPWAFAGASGVLATLHVAAGGLGPALGWTLGGIALAALVLAAARAARRVAPVKARRATIVHA